jgi:hypothetical protein
MNAREGVTVLEQNPHMSAIGASRGFGTMEA